MPQPLATSCSFILPPDMPSARADFCRKTNQPALQEPGAVIRCCLESLACRYRWVLERLEELTGQKLEVIHIVGGGCQNELLNQFTANACGRLVIAGPVEATALGNVLVQARTSGAISTLSEMRSVVRASSNLKHYVPADQPVWQEAYARFCELVAMPVA